MRVQSKVVGVDRLRRFGVSGIVEQNRTKNGAFGVEIRRQRSIKRQVGNRGHTLQCRPVPKRAPAVNLWLHLWKKLLLLQSAPRL